MRMHTFHGGLKPHVARKHCKSKIAHQGFFLFSNKNEKFPVPKTVPEKDREEWDDVFHIKLPALLRQAAYKKAFSPIFARIIGQEKVSKKFGRFGDGRRLQLKLSVAFKVANNRLQQASSVQATRRAQAEIDLLTRARRMLANHYRRNTAHLFRFLCLVGVSRRSLMLCFCRCVRMRSRGPSITESTCRLSNRGMGPCLKTFIWIRLHPVGLF